MNGRFLINLCIGLFLLTQCNIYAQNTVGLISYDPTQSYDGYTLLYPHNQAHVYLINNCGEIVHQWEGEPGTKPGNTAYLLSDGRLIKTSRPSSIIGDRIWAGGGGATVEIRTWDNDLEWSYTLNNDTARLHHDIAVIEKENQLSILMLAWELKTREESIQAGRDTTLLTENELWPDYIFEIVPETNDIIWEWHAWDHLIQDFDPSKDNYGVVNDFPNKININLDLDGTGEADWMHANSIDYGPLNDQIVLSVPHFSEVFIIDHSTTTEQAKTDSGGLGNLGGDLMFRWGNPQNYSDKDSTDQKLFFQHDVSFIDDFIDVIDPNYGKLSFFNNRIGSNYSGFGVLNPAFDMYDWSFQINEGVFAPAELDIALTHPDTTSVFSNGLSSIQYLNNGNFLVTSGRQGYSFELSNDNEIVWEYVTPLSGGFQVAQGSSLTLNENLTFKTLRYPTDFEAFENKDLSVKGYIELSPNTSFCDEILPTIDLGIDGQLNIYPNPARDMITLEWQEGIYVQVEIYNGLGQKMNNTLNLTGGRKYFDISNWENGFYYFVINGEKTAKLLVQHHR